METGKPYRLLVSDKVYVVSLVCQGFSEFRGQYATSAKCRVTNDGNIHMLRFKKRIMEMQVTDIQLTYF